MAESMIKKLVIAATISLIFLCGCDSVPRGAIGGSVSDTVTAPNADTTTAPPSETSLTETYIKYTFSGEDELFLSESVLIGDSIFRGLADSGLFNLGQVYAVSGVRAGEIADEKFPLPSGDGEIDLLTALANEKPDNIFILLGTNNAASYGREGINAFIRDYLGLISLIKIFSPGTKITALSVTPINNEREDFNNEIIAEYNDALSLAIDEFNDENVRFLDLDGELKNSSGLLKTRYSRYDGVHLTEQAYEAILWVICNN